MVLLDHPGATYDAAVAFWGGVQGVVPTRDASPYAEVGHVGTVHLAVQRLAADTDAARVHLDIETDDVVAEVARVTALGASVVEQRDGYAILTDPGGLVFCVVPVQTGDAFTAGATTWE